MSVPRVVPVAGLLIGFPALVRALLLLDDDPLLAVLGVLGVLAAMAVLLASLRYLNPDESSDSLSSVEDRSRF